MTSAGPQGSDAVTVVIPTRNRPQLLRSALAGVRRQDYPGVVESLVVFDGTPPDESLVDPDPRRPVRVMANERTSGLAGGRNTGILAAGSPLVAFCDDDDRWHPGRIRTQVAALEAHEDVVLVSCGIRVLYKQGVTERSLGTRRVDQRDLLRSRLTELHPSTFLMVRQRLLSDVGLVDEEIPGSYAEDYEFLLRVAGSGGILNVGDVLVDVRWHEQSFFAGRWDTISSALQWLLARYPQFADEPRGFARVSGQIAFAEGAAGRRRQAVQWARRTARADPRQPRAALALLVAARPTLAPRLLAALHRQGRGM